jgi:hypothetical protein
MPAIHNVFVKELLPTYDRVTTHKYEWTLLILDSNVDEAHSLT